MGEERGRKERGRIEEGGRKGGEGERKGNWRKMERTPFKQIPKTLTL